MQINNNKIKLNRQKMSQLIRRRPKYKILFKLNRLKAITWLNIHRDFKMFGKN